MTLTPNARRPHKDRAPSTSPERRFQFKHAADEIRLPIDTAFDEDRFKMGLHCRARNADPGGGILKRVTLQQGREHLGFRKREIEQFRRGAERRVLFGRGKRSSLYHKTRNVASMLHLKLGQSTFACFTYKRAARMKRAA